MDAFLPVGFPHSVSNDYLAYQTFDSLQAFFSTISALIANRALLKGLGVGDANSSATFALLLTIMKDAMSRVATIVFAHRFGLQIEPDAKRYRFLADLLNDSAFFLELYSPYLSPLGKVAALSFGQALRAMCGVAAGASKAALSVHFAKHDNLAELNAKEASQETAVGLMGLLIGTVVVRVVEDQTSVVYLMIVLVLAHLAMNYLGVRYVQMDVLNRQRATILFQEYLRSGKIMTPAQVAHEENILFWSPVMVDENGKRVARIEIAESYGEAMKTAVNGRIVDGQMHTKFIGKVVKGYVTPIKILLWHKCSAEDALQAWFEAVELAWSGPSLELVKTKSDGFDDEEKKEEEDEFRAHSVAFWDSLERAGWKLDSQSLETGVPVRLNILEGSKKKQ